jgi:hypothetical protein
VHDAQNEPPYHAFTLLSKYDALVLKIHQDVNIITQDTHNLELFYGLKNVADPLYHTDARRVK